jgi:hypothetical protein
VKAARIAGVNLRKSYLDIQLRKRPMTRKEFRALSAVDLSAGAGTIAPSFATRSRSPCSPSAGCGRTAAGDPHRDRGGDALADRQRHGQRGRDRRRERRAATNVDPSTFGAVKWGAYKYTSKIILVPAELLEDSAFDLASPSRPMAGERIARRQNRDFTVGDAAASPRASSPRRRSASPRPAPRRSRPTRSST